MTVKVPITTKMGEAIMWSLAQIGDRPRRTTDDPTDPLFVLLHAHPRPAIMKAVESLWPTAMGDWIEEPLSDLQKDILRVSVENSSWVRSYLRNPMTKDSPSYAEQARAALRELAVRLEAFGIEVNHIPDD